MTKPDRGNWEIGKLRTDRQIRVLMITSEWPTKESPNHVPFIVRQVEFLRAAGIQVEVFGFRGAKNPINYIRVWLQVRNRLRENSYDLIHAQWGHSGLLAMPTRKPLVVTFRGGEKEGILGDDGKYQMIGYVLRAVSYWVARRADELIIVSSHIKQSLPPRPVHVIPSGLDFDQLPIIPQNRARQMLGLPFSRRLVLFVGNPAEARKRYPLAEEVVASLDQDLDAQLVVAWGVPHSDIPVYMNACDALIFTSLLEGSPNVVKEALACNLPVVSVAVGDVPERLRGIEGCAVCQDGQRQSLTLELARVLRARERVNGRAAVRDLDERILTQRVIGIYQNALLRRKVLYSCEPNNPS